MSYIKVFPPNLQRQALSNSKGQRNSVISPSWAHTVSVTDLTEATVVKAKIKVILDDHIFEFLFRKAKNKLTVWRYACHWLFSRDRAECQQLKKLSLVVLRGLKLVFGRVNHLRAPVKNLQGVSSSPVKGFTIQKSTI